MKSNYSAYLQGKTLSIYQHDSGEKSPIAITSLNKNQRFYLSGNKVIHDSYLFRDGVIFTASSVEEAQQVLQQINYALRGRARDIARRWKFGGCAFIGASIAMAIAAAWYLGYTASKSEMPLLSEQTLAVSPNPQSKFDQARAPSIIATVKPTPVVPEIAVPPSAPITADIGTTQAAPAAPQATVDYQATSQRLKAAAASGRYTIPLSTGHERTLYVFADPLCPNCKIIEPALEAISQHYNVEIFPVTLIGKQQTVNLISPILCKPSQERKVLWKKLYEADAGMSPVDEKVQLESCATGDRAIAMNDGAFDIYNLPGTPSILADDGRYIPLQNLKSDSALKAFLNTSVSQN